MFLKPSNNGDSTSSFAIAEEVIGSLVCYLQFSTWHLKCTKLYREEANRAEDAMFVLCSGQDWEAVRVSLQIQMTWFYSRLNKPDSYSRPVWCTKKFSRALQQRWKLQLQLSCVPEAVLGLCTNSPDECDLAGACTRIQKDLGPLNKMLGVHTASWAPCSVTLVDDEIYPLLARGQEAESRMAACSLSCVQIFPLQSLTPVKGNEPDSSQAPSPLLCPRQSFPWHGASAWIAKQENSQVTSTPVLEASASSRQLFWSGWFMW